MIETRYVSANVREHRVDSRSFYATMRPVVSVTRESMSCAPAQLATVSLYNNSLTIVTLYRYRVKTEK